MEGCRRVGEEEEERDHWNDDDDDDDWNDWNDWIEDMDWDKSATVAGVRVRVSVSVRAGNDLDLHYWSGRRTLSVVLVHSCFLGMPWLRDPNAVRCGGTT